MQNASGALSENGPHDRLPKMNALADPGKEHARILVIDDLPENTNLLKNFLLPRGYVVDMACSGEEALQLVVETPPDVILLDLVMPEMDGYQVCESLKENPDTRHIPVVIVTGLSDREANLRAIEAGADDFLTKPFDSVLLEARIRSCIRAKSLQDKVIDYQRQLERHNEDLEHIVEERTTQVVRTQQVAVFSLAKLAESRDTETGDHLERMRCYAREVALEIMELPKYREELNESFANEIYQSSPLHDIGKVGIPDRILLKPGKLTDDEFAIMKSHSTIGGDTLKAADKEAGTNSFLAMGCEIAYFHHEKWDGTGYPQGLASEMIPLAARIVAISDVYDALSSKRPYKQPFKHQKSMAILTEGRGAHFDPDVFDAFVARETPILEIREKFQGEGDVSPLQKLVEEAERIQGSVQEV